MDVQSEMVERFEEKLMSAKRRRFLNECPGGQHGSTYVSAYKAAMTDALEALRALSPSLKEQERT